MSGRDVKKLALGDHDISEKQSKSQIATRSSNSWIIFPEFFIYDYQPDTDMIIRVCTPPNVKLNSEFATAWLGDENTGRYPRSSIRFLSEHILLLSNLIQLEWFKTQAALATQIGEIIIPLWIGDQNYYWQGNFVVAFLRSEAPVDDELKPLTLESPKEAVIPSSARSVAFSLEFPYLPHWTKKDQELASKLLHLWIAGHLDTNARCAPKRAALLTRVKKGDRTETLRLWLKAAARQWKAFQKARQKGSKQQDESVEKLDEKDRKEDVQDQESALEPQQRFAIRTFSSTWSISPETLLFTSGSDADISVEISPPVQLNDKKLVISINSEAIDKKFYVSDGKKIIIQNIQQLSIIQQYLSHVLNGQEKHSVVLTIYDDSHQYTRDITCTFASK